MADRRDWKRELAEAVAAGSVADLAAIAYQLLGRVEHDEEIRARHADKKRRQRMSGTSRMSPDVSGRPGTSGDIRDGVPPLKKNSTTTPPTARDAIAGLGDEKLQASLDQLRALMGDQWSDAAEFLLRRKYDTWQGWADGMLRDVGMASQFTPADLATVCRDDATLDKRLGSAFVLRTFLGYARRERLESTRSPPGEPRPIVARKGSHAPKPKPQIHEYPTADPDAKPKWQL